MIFTSPIGSETQTSGDAKITLVVSRQADMFFGVQIALHGKFGLNTDALRGQFFAFLRSTNRITDDNPLSRWADILRTQKGIVESLNACQNQPQCSVPFTVYEWFLTALRVRRGFYHFAERRRASARCESEKAGRGDVKHGKNWGSYESSDSDASG